MIEILTTGLPNTVQDQGRPGYLALGIGHGGAMDKEALAVGNVMVGNERTAAGIEVAFFPFRLRAHVDTEVAVTGADCAWTVEDRACPPWWATTIGAGQTLTLDRPKRDARAYVAFRGGIGLPLVIASRSTDAKAGFGGLDGRGLSRGDRLPLAEAPAAPPLPKGGVGAVIDRRRPVGPGPIELRTLPAAEYEAFTPQSREAFVSGDWSVTSEANRMGYRLDGEPLVLAEPLELLSHGIVPGTVQVPPAGQPIVQLADANTCGGYPKIATVIEADLWRLAQAPVGSRLRFRLTSQDAAVAALWTQASWMREFEAALGALVRR